MNLQVLIMAVVSKTDISRKIPNYFKFAKKMNLNVRSSLSSQNIFHDLKGPKVKKQSALTTLTDEQIRCVFHDYTFFPVWFRGQNFGSDCTSF